MPELPEVETIAQGLASTILGLTFKDIKLGDKKLRIPFPENLSNFVVDNKIVKIWRRAKYLILDLSNEYSLIFHLGMSGKIFVDNISNIYSFPPHTHFTAWLENNYIFYLVDPRRFGLLTICSTSEIDLHHLINNLGPEPFSINFTPLYLQQQLYNRKIPIKTALMDNKIIVGVGNIYASESLFLCNISPLTPANQISIEKLSLLIESIKTTLNKAIALGGSTLKDYHNISGDKGYFQNEFKVYGRINQPCIKCRNLIIKIIQSQRASFYCPKCQI